MFVVMNEVQKNIWGIVKSQHVVLDIVDFLKKVNSAFCNSEFHDRKIIDSYDRQLVCLDLTSQVNSKFAKMDVVKRMCNLFDDAYLCGDFDKPFEYHDDLTISDEKLFLVAKKVFEFYRNYLNENNLVDRSDFIARCVGDLSSKSDIKNFDFESVNFHESILDLFPNFCKVF